MFLRGWWAVLLLGTLPGLPSEGRCDGSLLDEDGLAGVTAASAAVIDSRLTSNGRREVRIGDGAQRNARALNSTNAAGGDAVQVTNVFHQPAPEHLVALPPVLDLNQSNRIAQREREEAAAGRVSSHGPSRDHRSSVTAWTTASAHVIEHAAHVDRHLTSHVTTTSFDAEVIPDRIGLFDTPVSLDPPTIELSPFTLDLPSVEVGFSIIESLLGPRFDLLGLNEFDLDFSPVQVTGARLDLGDVTLDGNDVVLTGPSLVLPALTFDFCFLNFRSCSLPLSNTTTVTLPGRRVGLGDIRLTGANPLGDLGIDLGYAIAGDGTITMDAGQVAFSGEIPLDLGLIQRTFDIDVDGIGIVDTVADHFELPTFEIPVDLTLDLPAPDGFNQTIAGEACTYGQDGSSCEPLDVTTTVVDSRTNTTTTISQRTASSSESSITFDVVRERGALELRAGQARVTVLRGGAVKEERYNLVLVDGSAQQNMALLNAVNAAAAIVGNGVNVTATAATRLPGPSGAGPRLSQRNRITQIGGL